MAPPPPRCDMGKLALALIAIVTNSSYTTIPPILPLEIDRQQIPEGYISLIFLAFTAGSLVAPPLVSRHFESIGTAKVIAYSLGGMSIGFWCLGHVFQLSGDDELQSSLHPRTDYSADSPDAEEEVEMEEEEEGIPPDGDAKSHAIVVALLTVIQFFLGAFYAVITTGYYSLATLIFTEKESAMSSVEAAVGIGYIVGPIFGSMLYDKMGYRTTYSTISMCMLAMAIVTMKCLARHLQDGGGGKQQERATTGVGGDEIGPADDVEEGQGLELSEMDSIMGRQSTNGHVVFAIEKTTSAQQQQQQPQPSAISLLRFPKILLGAITLCWVDVTWSFMEPLLSKQLDHNFDVNMSEIGMIFSISSIVYVPMVYLVQFLPSQGAAKHRTIAIAVMLTPIGVLLVGSNSLGVLVLGVFLNGILPTPVWVYLLPWMQEEALKLFPDPNASRCVNDLTATIYNSFLTLGQVVGYITGPLLASRGFKRTTQMVALLTFIQSILFYFCAGEFLPGGGGRQVVVLQSYKSSEEGEDEIGFLPEEVKDVPSVRRLTSRESTGSQNSSEEGEDGFLPEEKEELSVRRLPSRRPMPPGNSVNSDKGKTPPKEK